MALYTFQAPFQATYNIIAHLFLIGTCISLLQVNKLRHREFKPLTQGCSAHQ